MKCLTTLVVVDTLGLQVGPSWGYGGNGILGISRPSVVSIRPELQLLRL
jgi:hypothetical protein